MLVLLLFIHFLPSVLSTTPRSLYYIDNGRDQSEIYPIKNNGVAHFSSEILDVFGMDDPPTGAAKRAVDEPATRFMRALYARLSSDEAADGDSSSSSEPFDAADTIVSFSPTDAIPSSTYTGFRRLEFAMGDRRGESTALLSASLHVECRHMVDRFAIYHERYLLQHISLLSDDGLARLDSPHPLLPSTTANINVTKLFSSWLGGVVDPVLFVDSGAEGSDPTACSSFIVAALSGDIRAGGEGAGRRRERRSPGTIPSGERPRPPPKKTRRADPFRGGKADVSSGCRRQGLYVDFEELGWKEWVIAPEGYDAHFCAGRCSFPLGSHLNATNHAIVQTLVHVMHPHLAGEARCAPTRLSPMRILFIDNQHNVVQKKFKDMQVVGCGCQ